MERSSKRKGKTMSSNSPSCNSPSSLPVALLGLSLAAVLALAPGHAPLHAEGTPSPLERLEALEGDWVATADGEMVEAGQLVKTYRVTAAGSAVVETVFPGTDHEMTSVYHAEGDDLVLTHYCMLGNQPRMRAPATTGSRIEFAYDGGSNLDPAVDDHIHSGWIELLGPDEMRTEWTEHSAGEPRTVIELHLVRRK